MKQLARDLRKFGDNELRRELRAAGRDAAEIVVDEAKRLAPVGKTQKRGARLKNTIKPVVTSSKVGVKVGTKRVFYPQFVHYGHKKRGSRRGQGHGWVKEQPFLTDAIDNTYEEFFRVYRSRLDRLIAKFNRRRGV